MNYANHRARAYQLMAESRGYHLQDPQWQRNFRGRVNNLAGQYDATSEKADPNIVMIIDHIALRTRMVPKWEKLPI